MYWKSEILQQAERPVKDLEDKPEEITQEVEPKDKEIENKKERKEKRRKKTGGSVQNV